MSENQPFINIEAPGEEAADWLIQKMSAAGLFVIRTFNLQVARLTHTDCPCPHHGTDECDCQLMVLLVYGDGQTPISLVAHGYEGKTWFSVVDTPQQPADPDLLAFIQQTLVRSASDGLDSALVFNAT